MHILIAMTALVPTLGHRDLVQFAASIPGASVHVLVNGRSREPVPLDRRVSSLAQHFRQWPQVEVRGSLRDDAPQAPSQMPEGFWDWWVDEVNGAFPETGGNWGAVVASESYGLPLARALGATFLPYDLGRERNGARGTEVRGNMGKNWDRILPEFRSHLQLRATFFGQESVGKTTISRLVAEELGADWMPEFARPYLEMVGPEVTLGAMEDIHLGQAGLQGLAFAQATTPFLCLDTDLFSTVGYHAIMGTNAPEAVARDARALASDIYYLLPDNIPFEPDILRYGDGERESTMDFWEQLLGAEGLPWVQVPRGSLGEKVAWVAADMRARFAARTYPISAFERDGQGA